MYGTTTYVTEWQSAFAHTFMMFYSRCVVCETWMHMPETKTRVFHSTIHLGTCWHTTPHPSLHPPLPLHPHTPLPTAPQFFFYADLSNHCICRLLTGSCSAWWLCFSYKTFSAFPGKHLQLINFFEFLFFLSFSFSCFQYFNNNKELKTNQTALLHKWWKKSK